jgi:hypothetical protein
MPVDAAILKFVDRPVFLAKTHPPC